MPNDTNVPCTCVKEPCDCGATKSDTTGQVTTPTPNMGDNGMTNTQKWLWVIGLTAVAYYLIYKSESFK